VVLLDDDAGDVGVTLPTNWAAVIGPRAGYVAKLNLAFAMFPNEPWYACWGDDILCRPDGWDTYLAQAAGSDSIAYGDDGINADRACCLPFIGGDLVRKVGWLACPYLQHLYCDTVWRDIGRALEILQYFPEIATEHQHWSVGKQEYDRTAQERQCSGDQAAYHGFIVRHFEETLTRCRA
jgi:hypothetical protein